MLDLVDVISFNDYPAWYGVTTHIDDVQTSLMNAIQALQNDTEWVNNNFPSKPFMFSETGAGAIYGWHDPLKFIWTEEYQAAALNATVQFILGDPRILGVSLWEFFDHRVSPASISRPRTFNNKGSLNEYRKPKMAYFTVKSLFLEYKMSRIKNSVEELTAFLHKNRKSAISKTVAGC